ncbi:MAG: hypothetical protein H7228_10885 [Polaromonas sp.]|nr:hypothetical protein [Polaromonas sp.]
MKSKESPPTYIKDWLLAQGPKFDAGLPLPVRVEMSGQVRLLPILATDDYRGIAKGLSNSDIASEPDRL